MRFPKHAYPLIGYRYVLPPVRQSPVLMPRQHATRTIYATGYNPDPRKQSVAKLAAFIYNRHRRGGSG